MSDGFIDRPVTKLIWLLCHSAPLIKLALEQLSPKDTEYQKEEKQKEQHIH